MKGNGKEELQGRKGFSLDSFLPSVYNASASGGGMDDENGLP